MMFYILKLFFKLPFTMQIQEQIDNRCGSSHLKSNITTFSSICSYLKTSLGPFGLDKLFNNLITNDGYTIIKNLNFNNPIYKLSADIIEAMDLLVGDGTTSIIVLVDCILRSLCDYLMRNSDVCLDDAEQLILDVLLMQSVEFENIDRLVQHSINPTSVQRMDSINVNPINIPNYDNKEHCSITLCDGSFSEEQKKDLCSRNSIRDIKSKVLINLAKTPLNSKILKEHSEYFANIVVKALKLDESSLNLKSETNFVDIQPLILKIAGGSAVDSFLFQGIVFEKTFSYAGFEQQPKFIKNASIILTNEELEIKAERENAEMIVDVEEYEKSVEAEYTIIKQKLDFCIESGANVVLSSKAIGDYATQYFARFNVFCSGRVDKDCLKSIQKTCGGKILNNLVNNKKNKEEVKFVENIKSVENTNISIKDNAIQNNDIQADKTNLKDEVKTPIHLNDQWGFLASADYFEEKQVGTSRYNFIANKKASSIILRGCGKDVLNEMERSLIDSLSILKKNLSSRIITGGGSFEMNVANKLKESNNYLHNLIGNAFEDFIGILCNNMNKDKVSVLNRWRREIRNNKYLGLSEGKEDLKDMLEEGVIEPYSVKKNIIKGAFNAIKAILSIESTIMITKEQ